MVNKQPGSIEPEFSIGDSVEKRFGYRYPGIITCIDRNDPGVIRYVVRADHAMFKGMRHIFAPEQLKLRDPSPDAEKLMPIVHYRRAMQEASTRLFRWCLLCWLLGVVLGMFMILAIINLK